MLQPRRRKLLELAWLLLAGFCLQVTCDLGNDDGGNTGNGHVRAKRVGRDDNEDNTVLLLDNNGRNGRYLATAVPVVTSTARTFVQEGTTTEYATHVIGTRLDKGKLYASVVGTSSRVYYDTHLPRYSIDNQILPSNARGAVRPAAHLVYPDTEARISFSSLKSVSIHQTAVNSDSMSTKVLNNYPNDITAIKQSPIEGDLRESQKKSVVSFSSQSSSSKHVERKHKDIDAEEENYLVSPNQDFFKKRNVDKSVTVNPAQVVKPVLGLPTFTIKHDFAPSGFSANVEEEEEETTESKTVKDRVFQRGGKALYRNGIKTGNRKLDTVTYRGFADFTTTVGDTVIIFMPNTAASTEASKPVTIQMSTSTLNEEQIKIVTKMKTFYSHTPGMQTKTVTGHSISMHTSLPTHLVLPESNTRRVKAFLPAGIVHVVEGESSTEPIEEATKDTTTEHPENAVIEIAIEPSVVSVDSSMLAESDQLPSVTDSQTIFSQTSTEPLATFATTRTQILAAADQEKPLGLIKVLGGTRAYNSTTTLFTSLIYGTIIDGTYSQVIHSTSSVYESASTASVDMKVASLEVTTESEDILTTTENLPLTNSESISTNQVESTTPSLDIESVNNEVETGRKIKTRPQDQFIVDNNIEAEKIDLEDVSETSKSDTVKTEENLTRLIPTTVFKTFTYLTTFFIPDGSSTTTSVRSREVTSSDVNFVTKVISSNEDKLIISPTSVGLIQDSGTSIKTMEKEVEKQQTTTNSPVEKEDSTTTLLDDKTSTESTTLESDRSTEFITEVERATTEKMIDEEITTIGTTVKEEEGIIIDSEERTVPTPTTNDPGENEDEEIDLIFKTLYTTYTYLTTFFQESTTSVSSREVVVTNVVTSTLDRDFLLGATDAAVVSLFGKGESIPTSDIVPTSVGIGRPTTQPFSGFLKGSDESVNRSPNDFLETSETNNLEDATKTFYTTYTYFTTIFVDGETTISSRTEVYTNVVNPSLAISSTPTLQNIRPTSPAAVDDLDQDEAPQSQIQISGIFENLAASHRRPTLKSTPHYAYSSTILRSRLPASSEISSQGIRSSIGPDDSESNDIFIPQSKLKDGYATLSRSQINDASAAAYEGTTFKSPTTSGDTENELQNVTEEELTHEEPIMRMKEAILAQEQGGVHFSSLSKEAETEQSLKAEPSVTENVPEIQVRLDTFFAGEELSEEPVTMKSLSMVTDMTSSTSGGNTLPNALDDQVSSESNTEEIEPSPTLLLQTSFTTFTYFTTVYKGSTSSEVISRLETITNVVTETLSPTRSSVIEEDSTLPITYFTTFTYWTTLYRDGNTVITSREETVSNIITPTITLPTVLITATQAVELKKSNTDTAVVEPATVDDAKTEPTTYYTTYTYFTTSYIGNSTVLNSRLETVTNVVNETDDQSGRAIGASAPDQLIVDKITKTEAATFQTGLLSTIFTSEVTNGITTLFSTDVYGTYIDGLYAKILESSTQIVTDTISKSSTVQLQPTGVVSLNEGSIVDADGISTTYFTTKAIGTYIEQLYAQVIESTSSIKVDEEKKTQLATVSEGEHSQKTGLVRLIEGTNVKDHTTTFYESRVVGTVIDGRYAQIIESTSSYKIDKTTDSPKVVITATPAVTLGQDITGTSILSTSSNTGVIESSLGEDGTEEEQDEEEEEDEDEEDDGDGSLKKSKKSRLTFSTRKRTFTPVIRPFASRNRPTFNPRRKTAAASSATTITRTTLTPTITATPAAKSSESRGRFATNRRQSSVLNEIRPTVSSSRRFSRVRGSTPGLGATSFSLLSVSRGRSSSRVFPTATASLSGSSRRAGFYRSSSSRGGSSDFPQRSSIGASSSRFKIRPTSSGFARGSSSSSAISNNNDQVSLEENDITTLMTEETPGFTEDEQDSPTQALSTTTESARRSNPLLRFRRPPNLRAQTTSPAPSTTTSPRRNPLLRRTSDTNNNRITTTSTTAKPAPSFNSRFKNLNNNRPRPSNSLFPRRELLKKPEEEVKVEQKIEDKEDDDLLKEENEDDIGDNDYEGSEVEESNTEASPRRGKALTPQIRPFVGFQRRRSKRQTSEYGARRESAPRTTYNQRYRRPTSTRTLAPVQERVDIIEEEIITEAPKSRASGRFTPRPRPSQQTQPKIRSTTASSNTGRSQFTLREKDTTPRTAFRRPTPSPRRRPTTNVKDTTNSRQQSRLRTQTNSQTDAPQYSRASGRRYSNTNANSRRPQSRPRSRGDTTFDSYTPATYDGTITVTHRVPTEVTIPVVNGKITEYRNVITASPSIEILGPHQYTATAGKDGSTVLLLTSEMTGTLPGGVTEITQYVLHGTPTTSITFTPTTIRGRKTSYSHVVPSTVYEVERLVSTIHPQLSPNAPLANILLSQLLLGNLNLAQPNINPLLGLNQAPTAPATPITEFKTRATTYVTTVTKGTSTILPLTFRGKEILTTIVDMTLETITATEFITDTIVTTPTAAAAAANQQQLNSLLLPALLQAQLLQSQGQQSTQNPLFSLQHKQEPKIEDILGIDELTRGSVGKRRKQDDPDRQVRDSDKEYDEDELSLIEEEPKVTRFKPSRKKPARGQISDKKPPDPPPPATSVITLYVSGRRPGEFSTVLSTVVVDDDSSALIKKREAAFAAPDLFKVNPSQLPDPYSYLPTDQGYLENTILFSVNDVPVEISRMETQSLESIVGDVTKYNTADQFSPSLNGNPVSTKNVWTQNSSTKTDKITGHFLSKGPAEFTPLKRKVVIVVNGGGVENDTFKQQKSTTREKNGKAVDNINIKQIRKKRSSDGSFYEDDALPTKTSLRRARVRVRVPTARRISSDVNHELYSLLEAQQTDKIVDTEIDKSRSNRFGNHQQDLGVSRIKVIKAAVVEPNIKNEEDIHKKRIVIRRRRPIYGDSEEPRISTNSLLNESQYMKTHEQIVATSFSSAVETGSFHTSLSRRKVVVTKKRLVSTSSLILPTSSSHRRRIVVTKKRPLVFSSAENILLESMASLNPSVIIVSQTYNAPRVVQLTQTVDYQQKNSSQLPNLTLEESVKDTIMSDKMELVENLSDNSHNIQSSFIETLYEENTNSVELSSLTMELPLPDFKKSEISSFEIESSTYVQIEDTTTPSSSTLELDEAIEGFSTTSTLEDSPIFDGPRFIRPTRFSITRKPSRSKASFHGGRRKTTEPESSNSLNSGTKTGFRSSTSINTRGRFTTSSELKPSTAGNSFKPSSKAYRPSKSKTYGKANSVPASKFKDTDHELFTSPVSDLSSVLSEGTENPPSDIISVFSDSYNITVSPTTPVKESEVNLFVARVVTRTKLRTYTYIVTRVAGTEVVVTSSTEVKPHVTTETITQSLSLPDIQQTVRDGRLVSLAEARYNLATKVMSNGVEVIVAGDKSTLPGGAEILRVLTRPTTLAASTLTDHMLMFLPQKDSTDSQADLSSLLHANKFVTNTYLTTYKYLQTSVHGERTDISQEEYVVSNIVTGDRTVSTPVLTKAVTLTTSPILATGVFHTTYTFFNTIVDEDVNLVHTSTHTLDNTVTAPVDELTQIAQKETNIYLSTLDFSKTVTEGGVSQILSTQNVLTQLVVTKVTPQTNGIELASRKGPTTDVVKTYFVTYTYLNTYLEDGSTVISSDVSISTDIVTEKFYINNKRTSAPGLKSNTEHIKLQEFTKPAHLYATKTYLTTFTYFTTLLQEGADHKTSTLVSSHTSVVQNIVTESVSPELRNTLHTGSSIVHKQKKTAIQDVKPTQTKQETGALTIAPSLSSSMEDFSDNLNINNVVTGSTIIFFDENDQIDTHASQSATPALDIANLQPSQTTIHDDLSHVALIPQALTSQPRPQVEGYQTLVLADSTITSAGATLLPGDEVIMLTQSNGNITMIPVSDPANKKPQGGSFGPGGSEIQVSDLLSLGSLGINGLNALSPVINAMAGLIQSNNKHGNNRRNDSVVNSNPGFTYLDANDYQRPVFHSQGEQTSPRSPIYIPVGRFSEDVDTAESVNQELWSDSQGRHPSHGGNAIVLERPSLESPLLSDGIAISPGQVITANSDVIIGKPGILGPRPPKIHSEKEIPAGMRPPPLPRPNKPDRPDKEQYFGPPPSLDQVGHHSVNHHVGGPNSQGEHLSNHGAIRIQATQDQVSQNHPVRNYNGRPLPQNRDHQHSHNNLPHQQNRLPHRDHQQNKSPVREHQGTHPFMKDQHENHSLLREQQISHSQTNGHHNQPIIRDQSQNHLLIKDHHQNHPPIRNQFQGHIISRDQNIDHDSLLHPPPISNNFASLNSQPEFPIRTPTIGADIIVHPPILNENNYKQIITNNPNFQDFGQFPVSSGVQAVIDGQPQPNDIIRGKMPTGSHVLDSSAGQPLLVNIQPSQVANVIIKDGSSTANPFEINQEFLDRSPDGADNVHRFVGPVGSVHETRMDPAPVIDVGVRDIVGIHQQGINVDITPGQGINVDVSPGHRVNIPLSGHVHGNEHIAPSGIVLDELLNGRPSSHEVGFGRPQDPRINQRPFHSPPRQRFPAVSHRPGSQSHFEQNHVSNQISHAQNQEPNHISHGQNYPNTPIEFMVPPPLPPTQFNNQPVLIPLNGEVSQENDKDDHLFTDENDDEEDSLESEGGELIQASNSRPLRPGQLPAEIEKASKKRPLVRPTISLETPEEFMRPPQLPVSNINIHQVFDKRPLNKPSTFDVQVQPQVHFERPQIYAGNQLPEQDRANSTHFDERLELTSQSSSQESFVPDVNQQGRPHFEISQQKPSSTIFKRPIVSFDKQTVQTSPDQVTQSSTRRPLLTRIVVPNQSEIDREPVLGLSPPPEPQEVSKNPVLKSTNQRRPVPNYRNKTRPVSPYKFEIPPRPTENPNKSAQQEILTLSESIFQKKPSIPLQGFSSNNADIRPEDEIIQPVTIRQSQLYRPKTVRPLIPYKPVVQPSIKTLKTSVSKPTTNSPALQTVVIVGKPIQSHKPVHPISPKQSEISPKWDGHISGSETVHVDHVTKPTPLSRKPLPPSKVAASSLKPIYDNVRPSSVFKSTRVPIVAETIVEVYPKATKHVVSIPTSFITHTKTLFVTLTETTVVSSEGHRPSTRTLIVTKTQTSTLVDTVTQIHTLLQPTEIRATATVTTTVSQYPPGSPFDPANYPQFPVKMGPNVKPTVGSNKTVQVKAEKKDIEVKKAPEENDTFFVVVNDKKHSSVNVNTLNKDKNALMFDVVEEEIASRDETEPNNEVNRAVLLGGVLVAAPPPRHGPATTACRPDCSPARNELCQRVNGQMRCVCRPGFARMFPDRPCKPTYTYTLRLDLERHGKEPLKYEAALKNMSSPKFRALAEASREGLDRLVMQSDLRDIYHGVAINGFQPAKKKDGVVVNFYVQLSDNANETRLKDVFKKSLRTSNFSLGGTDVFADKELLQHLQAEDFDECLGSQFHDCSENSHCFNLRGTYTCSCKEGFADLSENSLFPGRVCSAELIGCEKCHYHGTCYSRGDDQLMCECFQWYSGENCQVNLKVLLIALVTIGSLLLGLLLVCAVLTCLKRSRHSQHGHNAPGFLRYRGPPRTLDKRAMIADSSSEGSVDNGPVFMAPAHQMESSLGKPVLKGGRKMSEVHPSGTMISVGYGDQRDRSLTVMIPRAKYRPVPPTSPHLTMSTFGVEENKRAIIQQKLIGYLEHGVQLTQECRTMNARRKPSNVTNLSGELTPTKKMSVPRKPSTGALVSAGFEVSATVGQQVGQVGQKQEAAIEIMTPHNAMGAQFPTMRTNERTVSEARSCDETTVQPPTKSFHGQSHYGSKPSSRNRDEAHTMAERDLGSTLLMPQTHLYRPDRGSDISNFDSL